MQFRIGPIPTSDTFTPDHSVWKRLREPSLWLAIAVSLPIGIAIAYGLGWAWLSFTAVRPGISIKTGSGVEILSSGSGVLASLLLLILVHEMLHAFAYPRCGFSSSTVIGFWPSRGMFYAHYDGEVSRNRFILVLVLPFAVISVGVFVLSVLFDLQFPTLAFLSVLNAVFSCVDLFGVALVFWQLPRQARVRNHGWTTWWRAAEFIA